MGNSYSGSYQRVLWKINGSTNTEYGDTLTDAGSHSDYVSATMSLGISLAVNDTVEINNNGPIPTYGSSYGSFSGYLVG
jgi:hypothetical protein